jgi:hypothetical protein
VSKHVGIHTLDSRMRAQSRGEHQVRVRREQTRRATPSRTRRFRLDRIEPSRPVVVHASLRVGLVNVSGYMCLRTSEWVGAMVASKLTIIQPGTHTSRRVGLIKCEG